MNIIRRSEIHVLRNSGVESEQLLSPENAPASEVTITRVTIPVGATSPRHTHESSEQAWVAIEGQGTLLLGQDRTDELRQGDVVRFAAGDVHGFSNTGSVPFVYLSVTTPPLNFRKAYEATWTAAS